jgi:hypothetical protein
MSDSGTPNPPRNRDTRLRFEQWAHNPTCQANTLSAVHGIQMAAVAKREGLKPTMGQSPFAIARGQTFERTLFRDDGKTLREALIEAGVLPSNADGLADFRMRRHGGRMPDLDAAKEATTALLGELASGRPAASLVASPTLLIPGGVMLPEAILVIDVLAVTYDNGAPVLTVGEIKTYPDRGGYTDPAELATARAQAGVYVHGLTVTLAAMGFADRVRVNHQGFLVLSRPGFNRPSVRAGEDLRYQAMRAQRGFLQLEEAAKGLPPPGEDDREAAILAAATDYRSQCVSFCDRAAGCFQRALEANDPVVLGEDVRRFLGGVPLGRAISLLGGDPPRNKMERELLTAIGRGNGQ